MQNTFAPEYKPRGPGGPPHPHYRKISAGDEIKISYTELLEPTIIRHICLDQYAQEQINIQACAQSTKVTTN